MSGASLPPLSSCSRLCLSPNWARLSGGLPGSLGRRLSGPILGEASPPPTHPAGVERGMWSSQKPRPSDCHSPVHVRPPQDLTCTQKEPFFFFFLKRHIIKCSLDVANGCLLVCFLICARFGFIHTFNTFGTLFP